MQASEIIDKLNTKLESAKEKDLRFFRIEEFKRIIVRNGEFSETCDECRQFQPAIEKILGQIDVAVEHPGKVRRQYDKLIDILATHQRKVHGFYPPYYYTYLYSFFGILSGLALGALLGLIILPEKIWHFIVVGFIAGTIISQILGGRKDKTIRANKKLL